MHCFRLPLQDHVIRISHYHETQVKGNVLWINVGRQRKLKSSHIKRILKQTMRFWGKYFRTDISVMQKKFLISRRALDFKDMVNPCRGITRKEHIYIYYYECLFDEGFLNRDSSLLLDFRLNETDRKQRKGGKWMRKNIKTLLPILRRKMRWLMS